MSDVLCRTKDRALRMSGVAILVAGLCVTGFGIAASGASAAVGACTPPAGSGLQKNINTNAGCDVSNGQADFPITGFIADNGLAPNQTVTFEDGYEGLSTHLFYYGAYALTLNCTAGTPTSQTATYVVQQGTGSYPSTPPTLTSGSLPQVTANASGDIVCAYSLTVANPPTGHLNSSKNDLWTLGSGGQHTATQSVKPPDVTTTTTTTTSTTVAPTTTTSTTVAPTTTTSTTVAPTTTTSTLTPSSSSAGASATTTTDGTSTTAAAVTTTPPSSSALAFTGSNASLLAAVGLLLTAVGVFLLQLSKIRRRWNR